MRAPITRLLAVVAVIGGVVAFVVRRGGTALPTPPWRTAPESGTDGGRLEYDGPHGGDPLEAGGSSPDDARLLARVQSELFRDASLPKGDILLDVAAGVITVRGQVPAGLVDDVPVRVGAVEGVVRVENLLHPPGTPPPHAAG